MSYLRIGVVAFLASLIQLTGQVLLPPPRHVRVVSKDFSLFLTWVPDESYPPGVSYMVQWKDPYDGHWEEVSHCRDILGRDCNITCVPTELHNRYWVQIRAQARSPSGMVSSHWVQLKNIDYEVFVELAPPNLQVNKTENTLVVSATFLYPSCAKDIFQHLSYNLEVWEAGTENKMEYNQLDKNVVELNTTQWGSGNYCLRAQSYFPRNKKWSPFSPPLCTQLHKKGAALQREEIWKVMVALPFLLLLLASPLSIFFWYKHRFKHVKMPQALEFSTLNSPKEVVGAMEVITVDALLCTSVPLESGKTNRLRLQVHLARSPRPLLSEEDDEDKEDEDDSGSPTPYTEVHSFKTKGSRLQRSSTGWMETDAASTSGSGPPRGAYLPEVMVSGPSLSTVRLTKDAAFGSSESQWASQSEDFSADDPLEILVTCPADRRERQAEREIDVLPLSPRQAGGIGFPSPTRWPFVAARDHPEATCGQLDISWLLEEQFLDQERFEKDTSGCSPLADEIPLLATSYEEDVEDVAPGGGGEGGGVGGLSSRMRFCSYEPRHMPYHSRMPVV